MSYITGYSFSNLHLNISFDAARWYLLDNKDEHDVLHTDDFVLCWNWGISNVKGALADAIRDGKKVRAVGAGWSLSDVQQTPDYLFNTSLLNLVQVGLAGYTVSGTDPAPWCICQCGAAVADINDALQASNMALSTSGASDGQSIVGAFSTGTHGSAFNFGSMPDFVEGLHIIVTDSLHYWIEGDQPIVNQDFIDNYAPGATRINNTAILNAAVISFGGFGFIHAALLKVEPLYLLKHTQNYNVWNDVLTCLNGPSGIDVKLKLPTDALYNFTAIGNPYIPGTWVTHTMQKLSYDPATAVGPKPVKPDIGTGADAMAVIGAICNAFPGGIPVFMDLTLKTIKKQYPLIDGVSNFPGNTFTYGKSVSKGKALSVELGVDAGNVQAAANVIFAVCQKVQYPGLISFRYIKQSKATLGFLKYPVSCAIEFPAVYCDETNAFYNAMYQALDDAGIEYTFHWGQCNNLDAGNLIKKYGEAAVKNWLNARYSILQTTAQQDMFSNDFMKRIGLDVHGAPPPPPTGTESTS